MPPAVEEAAIDSDLEYLKVDRVFAEAKREVAHRVRKILNIKTPYATAGNSKKVRYIVN